MRGGVRSVLDASEMRVWLPQLLGILLGCCAWAGEASDPVSPAERETAPAMESANESASTEIVAGATEVKRVHVIPVQKQIGSAVLYVVRRGIKEAIEQKADAVILNMDTPGGALNSTFEIMEAIARFPGITITYVNSEAISAGAFISATTNEIWFAPDGIIGAAAPVSMGGQDVEATMRMKIVSYLKARVRSMSEGKGYRGDVISAMIDPDHELKIGETVIKGKGELLSLTASEAAKMYGEPPQALLSAGTAKSLEDLIAQRFGEAQPAVTRLETTWSEEAAAWLNAITPVLLGLGMLALFIEFKTPGFGIFGIVGIACLAIVFLGNYVAGLSGHEPMLVFGLGLLLVAVELFFVPGVFVIALSGLALMLGALVWSMMDSWPKEAVPVAWSSELLVTPLANLSLGILIAVGLGVALAKFLPRSVFLDRLVLGTAIGGTTTMEEASAGEVVDELIGARGVAVSALRPGGEVEIAGRRYEAQVEVGSVEYGESVVVRRRTAFGLIVERADS